MTDKIAIVSTVRDPGISLLFFLKYHFEIGFDHIFLFFDNPSDSMIPQVQGMSNVTIRVNDQLLQEEWKTTKTFRENLAYTGFLNKEVMARQVLNVEVAKKMVMENFDIDWLLHIDHDELFFIQNSSLKEYFNSLSQRGIESMKFLNHEAIPEKIEVDNIFEDVTLFKKNPFLLLKKQRDIVLQSNDRDYFLYYSNGKSAGRISKELLPQTVHDFKFQKQQNVTANPCVFHFPVCGLKNFTDKYKTLGAFSDKWFDAISIKDSVPFHTEARDAVNRNTMEFAGDFYNKKIMKSAEKISFYLQEEIYFRRKFTITQAIS